MLSLEDTIRSSLEEFQAEFHRKQFTSTMHIIGQTWAYLLPLTLRLTAASIRSFTIIPLV